MSDTGQADIIAFLAAPDTYGVSGPVEMIATHASFVFLVGDRAYKLKRAISTTVSASGPLPSKPSSPDDSRVMCLTPR